MNGIYALFVTFAEDRTIEVGALGTLSFESGEYCYIGSAMNGLEHRIRRHLSSNKKIRWHIDFLTVSADSAEAYFSENGEECGLRYAAERCGMRPAIKGFGCSDCRCDTHLMISDKGSKERFVTAAGLTRFRQCSEAMER